MKRERFIEQAPKHILAMRHAVKFAKLDYDTVCDVVSMTLEKVLKHKRYNKITSVKTVRGFLCRLAAYQALDYVRKEKVRAQYIKRLPEAGEDYLAIKTEDSKELTECPFCFVGILNQYGGCSNVCHTILPRDTVHKNKVERFEGLTLGLEFEYDKKADIKKALDKLTEEERAFVKAVVMGNETLATYSCSSGISTAQAWRRWAMAREKLQNYLADYAKRTVHLHSASQFRDALTS